MTPQKIPIFLLTGFLGSGKTTLLQAWLQDPVLKDAALIINELGEVGVDQALLTSASEASSLLSNACVCCTGLQGLSQALEDLFWARLQRRVHKFPQLIIETTGLAMPGPILETLAESPLLLERYEWAGTITCVSATSYKQVMVEFKEAQSQLTQADLCILTKTDLVNPEQLALARLELGEFLAHHDLMTPILNSGQASLSAHEMLGVLQRRTQDASKATDPKKTSIVKKTSQSSSPPSKEKGSSAAQGHDHDHDQHDLSPEYKDGGSTHHQEHVRDHGYEQDQAQHDHHHHLHAHAYFWHMPETTSLSVRQSEVRELKNLLGTHLLRLKGLVQVDEGVRLIQMSPFDSEEVVQAHEEQPLASSIESAEERGGEGSNPSPTPWGLTVIVNHPLPLETEQAFKELLGL